MRILIDQPVFHRTYPRISFVGSVIVAPAKPPTRWWKHVETKNLPIHESWNWLSLPTWLDFCGKLI